MKLQKILCIAAILPLCATNNLFACQLAGSSFYAARSQSVNAARDLVGFCQFLTRPHCGFEGMLLAVPSYEQSFKSYRIAQYYFDTDTIRVTGSHVPDRDCNDFLADYFGLSPSFASTVSMVPSIRSAFVNFDAYLSYNSWYLRVQAPICWSRWHYQLKECLDNDGTSTVFPSLYMAQNTVQEPISSFTDAICGNHTWGNVQQGLENSIICGAKHKHGCADLRMFLGWHILRDTRRYVGLNIILAAPTGSNVTGKYFFEPEVGNCHHWEVGAGFDGRILVWECEGKHALSLYGTIHATHLCRARQQRAFDFTVNGFASRYLLLKEFDESGNYNGNIVPACNVTTLPCHVWAGGQFDIAAMIGYESQGLEIDFGYNAWIRTREHVSICGSIPSNRYGIKGIQNVVYADGSPNNLTQSTATINGNQLTVAAQEANADTNSPVFISVTDLNPCSAAARSAFTNKFFGHVGYKWTNHCVAQPYLGLGGEVEFEGLCAEENRQANNNSVAQWGIWLKGGVLFN